MKKLAALLVFIAAPAATQTLPTVCNPNAPGDCVRAAPVVNPDGSYIGGGSGSIVRGTITEGPGTITTGGSGQQVFAASAARNYVSCQNPTTATEPLYYRFASTATTTSASKALQPGGEFTFAVGFVPNQALSVAAATTGHSFICWQG